MFEVHIFTYFHIGHKCPPRCLRGQIIGKRIFNNINSESLKNLVPGPVFDLTGSGGIIKKNVATFTGEHGTIKIVSTIKQLVNTNLEVKTRV